MKGKTRKKLQNIDFSKITPKMQIENVKHSPLYEKALLNNKTHKESDHSRNVTTWE